MSNIGRKTIISNQTRNFIINAHNKGYSIRDIVKYINEKLGKNISKTTVQRVISNYKKNNTKTNEFESGKGIKIAPVQKARPENNILIVKANENGHAEDSGKVRPAITDRIYMDYMEELEKSDLIKALRIRYMPIARKYSMNFRQYLENACELEKQYLENDIVISGAHNEPDLKEALEAAVLGKIIKGL